MKSSSIILRALIAFLFISSCAGEKEDAFVVLLDSHPKGLDPRFATSDGSAKLIGLLHAGLVDTDTANGEPELELAKSISQPSPVEYVIELRDDITFHDGHPVTAEDVEFTFMQLDSEIVKSPFAGKKKRIETFLVHDDRRITITLKEPYAPFMSELGLGVMPKHICEGFKECPGDPIGAGPFRFKSQDDQGVYRFDAFDKYFAGKPPIEHLMFRVVKDDNTRLIALLGKTANLVQNAVAPLMLPVVADDKQLEVQSDSSFKYTYLGFNLEHDILKNLDVRRAIAYGINRDKIVEYKFRGYAKMSTGLLAPNHWAYNDQVTHYDYDPERAKKLLDQAGYPDPDGDGPQTRFEIEFKVSASKFRRALAELIANQLSRIGIKVTVRSYEWGTFFDDIKSRNFAMTTLQWPSITDPSIYHWIFHSTNIPTPDNKSAGANRGAYKNPKIDELLDAGNIETDREKRKKIYHEVQEILANDLPYVSLWHEDNIAIMKKGSTGYRVIPNARFETLKTTRYGD